MESRPHRWHVQQIGAGPDLLMLHGAGGATHSWRALAPLLAPHLRLTMIDLPGHGFTRAGTRARSGLDPMAEDVANLLAKLGVNPAAILGHSAGAALALRLSLSRGGTMPVVSVNGAFAMFDGIAGVLFPLMAKALALNPLTVPLFTVGANPARTRRLLESTGSALDAEGLSQYHRLISDRSHVAGALAMMASWSLDGLVRDAPGQGLPILFLVGGRDGTVPPRVSEDMAARLPGARVLAEPDLGHLMHEEAAERCARPMLEFLDHVGVIDEKV